VGQTVETIDQYQALERQARKLLTPCGAGKMVWRVWGAPADARPPLVLLHGGSGFWGHWARNVPALLAQGRQVFAVDLPANGQSDPPPVGEDGDALPPFLEEGAAALGLEKFDLVGFSFGAMVAGFYAAQYPARVSKLVMVGAPALTQKPIKRPRMMEWASLPDGAARRAAWRNNLRALMLARDESCDDLAMEIYVAGLLADRLTKRRLAGTDILRATMSRVKAPVWALWGGEDVLAKSAFPAIEEGLRGAPDFRAMRLVEGAGHWVQFEAAAETDAILRQWLQD
jgi:pimeloyl-ACP methyl ester carboxylesterase